MASITGTAEGNRLFGTQKGNDTLNGSDPWRPTSRISCCLGRPR